MNRIVTLTIAASLIFLAQSALACDYPRRVLIPNGNTASKEDMLESQKGVKQYVADMQIYLDCIVDEEKIARDAMGDMQPETEQEREDMVNKKYNAAVDEMERLAAQFNAERQAYMARDKD